MDHLAVVGHLHVGRGLVGAHRVERHRQGLLGAGRDAALQEHALPQPRLGGAALDAEVHGHGARTGLGAGVDACDLRRDAALGALQAQLGRLADAHAGGVGGRHQHLDFQAREVHDLQDARLHGHALPVLRQALRDQAVDGAAQHRVGQRLAGHLRGGDGGLVRGLGRVQAGQRGVERRLGDESLGHERLVVVELALADGHLRLRSAGLLFGLAHARLGFGRVDARHHLAGAHGVALAQGEVLQLPGDARLDGGGVHSAHAARDGHAEAERARLHGQQLVRRDVQHDMLGPQRGGLLLLRLARRHCAQRAGRDHGQHDGGDHPGNQTFHGKGCEEGGGAAHRPCSRWSIWWSMKACGLKSAPCGMQATGEWRVSVRNISGATTVWTA